MRKYNRRDFVRLCTAALGTSVAPLSLLYSRAAAGDCLINGASNGFGPLAQAIPLNTYDLGQTGPGDLVGQALLQLPPGFVYTAFSITGQTMSDGTLVPGDHDGMACYPFAFRGYYSEAETLRRRKEGVNLPAGRPPPSLLYFLVRNHELSPNENEFGNTLGVVGSEDKKYDPMVNGGGTTTLVVDFKGKLIADFPSLAGTIRNCAGGPTPWNTWISCEEDVRTPATTSSVSVPHGYNFEVPVFNRNMVKAEPLVEMGRFNHEAIAVDPETGYVYETEDRGDGAFYRFVPRVKPEKYGDLQQGGDLYAMVIDPDQFADCDMTPLPVTTSPGGSDLVNTSAGLSSFLGQPLSVGWVKLNNVDPAGDTLRFEAQFFGAAIFDRGEGMWYADGLIYFVCTSGGVSRNGQVWAYDPKRETVTLLVESTSSADLDNADNITVAPDGTLYLCEDASSADVVGVDKLGRLFKFARNNYDNSEFAGACFSPDGCLMFVNQQGPGITYCIFREDGMPIDVPV